MTPSSETLYPDTWDVQRKLCPVCKETKASDKFTTDKRNRDGRGANCRKCEMQRNKARNARKSMTTYDESIIKYCLQCFIPKPLSFFSKKPSGKYGVDARCKECRAINNRKWLEANYDRESLKWREEYAQKKLDPDYLKIRYEEDRLAKLGVTSEWFKEKLASQNGCCAICGSDSSVNKKAFAIDHNHDCCGAGRGCNKCRRDLLCVGCNTKLGVLENPEWMAKAIAYIARHRMNQSCSSVTSMELWHLMFPPVPSV